MSMRAWCVGMSLGVGLFVGACFDPPKESPLTSGDLDCEVGAQGCPCDVGATCNQGLVCEAGTCVPGSDPTGTSGMTTIDVPGSTSEVVDETTAADGTTFAVDDTTTGDATTGDATTGDATTGDATTGDATTEGSTTGEPPPPAMQTVNFPTPDDPRVILVGTLPWNAGDYFEGVRDTIVPSVSQLDVHIPIVNNVLSDCGFQEAQVILNGVPLGSFVISQGTAVIDQSFPAPNVVGPQYTIRYQTVATVASGCGSAGYDEMSSTVTLWE